MTIDLLIVEDKVDEAIYAQRDAALAGFRNFVAATDLSAALSYLDQNPKYVATDLFFPSGSLQTVNYSNRFLPLYEKFETERFPVYGDEINPVKGAVGAWAELFDTTPEKCVEEIMPKYFDEKLLNAAKDAVYGRKDHSKYKAFQKIKENIANGTNLPLGIIVAEEAQRRNIPCVIVTSTYHHDDAFSPIARELKVKSFDSLVEGRKNWAAGIKFLQGVNQNV